MKNLKKALALLLVIVLTASATLGITLALLTDETEVKHNVFTTGNVDVELTEKVGGETYGKVEETADGAEYKLIAPGDELTKEVNVKNNGTIPAYLAVTVNLNKAAEIVAAIDQYYTDKGYNANQIQQVYEKIFEGWGLKYNASGVTPTNALPIDSTLLRVDTAVTDAADVAANAADNWFTYYGEDMAANELQYTYYLYLLPGEDVTLFTGINVPEYFKNEQMAMFNGLVIDIQGAAVQAENFANPQEAFKALRLEQTTNTLPNLPQAIVSNNDELAAAISAGNTDIQLNDGTYQMPAVAKGKTLTLSGSHNAVIEVVPAGQGEANGQLDYNLDGANVTFNGVTIKTNSQLYAGYARLSATYNDCVIQNTYNLGVGTSEFNNCTFNITNEYIRVGGASAATFNGCTFNTDGRAILIFQDGTKVAQTVTVKDCTFNATASAKTWNGIHVAAVSYDGSQGGTYTVNFEGNNVVDTDFNGLWQIKAGEANVTVNGLN